MVAVKGSKQHQMVVVPYRPWHRVGGALLVLTLAAVGAWVAFEQGMDRGLATRVEVIAERDAIRGQLGESLRRIEAMQQEIADLKVGGEIDSRAHEEVRETVETLQDEIAQLNEEVRFYKGVMVPNAQEKGLRIERLDIRNGGNGNQYRYSLLLTQVVDKHEYIQGDVRLQLEGMRGEQEASIPWEEVSDTGESIRFRFRYFQNIDGEVMVPDDFEPRSVSVVAQASGRGPRLEKRFSWEG